MSTILIFESLVKSSLKNASILYSVFYLVVEDIGMELFL